MNDFNLLDKTGEKRTIKAAKNRNAFVTELNETIRGIRELIRSIVLSKFRTELLPIICNKISYWNGGHLISHLATMAFLAMRNNNSYISLSKIYKTLCGKNNAT